MIFGKVRELLQMQADFGEFYNRHASILILA